MKITVLGAGSAFTYDQFQSNFLMEFGNEKILFDAGSDIRWSLKKQNVDVNTLTGIFVSHLHADHVGGLEFLAFSRFFNPSLPKLKLYTSKYIIDDLWSNTLKGGLSTYEGKVLTIDDYFDVVTIDTNETIKIISHEFTTVQMVHIMSGFKIMPTFGLMIELCKMTYADKPVKKIFITADTQYSPYQIRKFYDMADVILHDCETTPFKSHVHAHYDDLKTLDEEHKNKMWLYHYADNVLQDFEHYQDDAIKNGFKGFLEMGQVLDFKNYE